MASQIAPSNGNHLRRFADVDDLFDNIDNAVILLWVNELHEKKTAQAAQGKRYRTKQQMFAKLAMEHLDPDEIRRVAEAAAGKGEV